MQLSLDRVWRSRHGQRLLGIWERARFYAVGRKESRAVRAQLQGLSAKPVTPLGSHLLILTAFTVEIAEYGDMTAEGKQRYAQSKGYRFMCYDKAESFDRERDATWSKIPFILKAFEDPDIHWVFWTDADAAVVNAGVWMENLVDEKHDLIISRDPTGLNAGNFLMRNTPWTKGLLAKAWEREDLARRLYHEQEALSDLIKGDWNGATTKVSVVSQRLFNSYHYPDYLGRLSPLPGDGTFNEKDFILHVPGLPHAERIERLREYCRLNQAGREER